MAKRNLASLRKLSASVITDASRGLLDEAARVRTRAAQLKENQLGIQLALMTLAHKLGGIYEFAFVSSFGDRPKLHVTTRNAESFKDKRVLDALGFLSGSFEAADTQDYASTLNREFRFVSDRFDVTLDVSVRTDSPTCRKVLVKEEVKTFTNPIYKIECD